MTFHSRRRKLTKRQKAQNPLTDYVFTNSLNGEDVVVQAHSSKDAYKLLKSRFYGLIDLTVFKEKTDVRHPQTDASS